MTSKKFFSLLAISLGSLKMRSLRSLRSVSGEEKATRRRRSVRWVRELRSLLFIIKSKISLSRMLNISTHCYATSYDYALASRLVITFSNKCVVVSKKEEVKTCFSLRYLWLSQRTSTMERTGTNLL